MENHFTNKVKLLNKLFARVKYLCIYTKYEIHKCNSIFLIVALAPSFLFRNFEAFFE